jgi:hypothetical protein
MTRWVMALIAFVSLAKSNHKMIDFVEANGASDDQVNCDDIVQQSWSDEDQDTSQKRDERRYMSYRERHSKTPLIACCG